MQTIYYVSYHNSCLVTGNVEVGWLTTQFPSCSNLRMQGEVTWLNVKLDCIVQLRVVCLHAVHLFISIKMHCFNNRSVVQVLRELCAVNTEQCSIAWWDVRERDVPRSASRVLWLAGGSEMAEVARCLDLS